MHQDLTLTSGDYETFSAVILNFKMAAVMAVVCEVMKPGKLPTTYSLGCFPTLTLLRPSKQT